MDRKKKLREAQSKRSLNERFIYLASSLRDFQPRKSAFRISVIYIAIGLIWILSSDKILDLLSVDRKLITSISMLKGLGYVFVTGILLYFLVLKSIERIRFISQLLLENYEELTSVYEELTASEQELARQIELLKESEEKYRLVSEATNDAIWDEKHGKRNFTERWYEITGYTSDEVSEMEDWMTLIHPDDIGMVREKLEWHKKNRNPYYRCEYRIKHKNGQYRWILSRAILIFDEQGEIARSAGSHTDITDLKTYQEQLAQLAFKDFLTDLPNRTSLFKDVERQFSGNPDAKVALMFIDMDNFKYINDTIGHLSGDELIAYAGRRLTALTDERSSVYRIGGDEFIVVINEYKDTEEIESFAQKIVESFGTPFELSSSTINITVSIGIALYPLDGKDIDTLLKCADMAMYEAKTNLRGRYVFYHRDMEQKVNERMMIENELRLALERNEFHLNYQPQIDMETGKICCLEALIRWNNNKLGYVSPLRFISIAEETHLINPIGDWVLENSCRFLKQLHEQGYTGIAMSVNVSIIQLLQQDFTGKLMEIIEKTGICPENLELEITESVIIESYEAIKDKLEDLMSRGITIALDDFGKGYSSLSYLTQIPIATLKIDKSFIDTIGTERFDMSLTSMIITIGRKLGLSVVAEGVESERQLEYLKQYKCHKAQGYYFSRPLSEEGIFEFLRKISNSCDS